VSMKAMHDANIDADDSRANSYSYRKGGEKGTETLDTHTPMHMCKGTDKNVARWEWGENR
jgi:hypothetical protein